MVHATSGFRGTRVGVTEGSAPKIQPNDFVGERLPRIRVSYWCAKGHETRPVFIKLPEDQIPVVWDCRRCGGTATRDESRRSFHTIPTRATRATLSTLKNDAPARTPKTYWLERWNG